MEAQEHCYGLYDLPGAWSASITAQASGTSRSNLETKSGNIIHCVVV